MSADEGVVYGLAGTLENEAIRPHVAGRFVDLLAAVEQPPAMIAFLDNQYSLGKDSSAASFAAQFRGAGAGQPKRQFGINENLAREILELHTLGVHGGYSQADVSSFAEIITGWSIGGGKGRLAGGVPGRFISATTCTSRVRRCFSARPTPSKANVRARRCLPIWRAVPKPPISSPPSWCGISLRTNRRRPPWIESPESWDINARKFKTPEDFVFSTLRALNVSPAQPEEVIRTFDLLGQRQYTPGSPAGWPDTSKSWDGSDALMHRVLWASRVGANYEGGVEPADLAAASLGAYARPETLTALRRAATSGQAVTLLLMSPEFQRR